MRPSVDGPGGGDEKVGKLHIRTGDDDTYYLENAVKLLERSFARLSPSPAATWGALTTYAVVKAPRVRP